MAKHKKLKPIGDYLDDKSEMVEQIFSSIPIVEIKNMVPIKLQGMPLHELKAECLVELLGIEDEQILNILAGHKSKDDISSESEHEDTSRREMSKKRKSQEDENKGSKKKKTDIGNTELPSCSTNSTISNKKTSKTSKTLNNEETVVVSDDEDVESAGKEEKSLLDLLELEMRARAIRSLLKKEDEIRAQKILSEYKDEPDDIIPVDVEHPQIELLSDSDDEKIDCGSSTSGCAKQIQLLGEDRLAVEDIEVLDSLLGITPSDDNGTITIVDDDSIEIDVNEHIDKVVTQQPRFGHNKKCEENTLQSTITAEGYRGKDLSVANRKEKVNNRTFSFDDQGKLKNISLENSKERKKTIRAKRGISKRKPLPENSKIISFKMSNNGEDIIQKEYLSHKKKASASTKNKEVISPKNSLRLKKLRKPRDDGSSEKCNNKVSSDVKKIPGINAPKGINDVTEPSVLHALNLIEDEPSSVVEANPQESMINECSINGSATELTEVSAGKERCKSSRICTENNVNLVMNETFLDVCSTKDSGASDINNVHDEKSPNMPAKSENQEANEVSLNPHDDELDYEDDNECVDTYMEQDLHEVIGQCNSRGKKYENVKTSLKIDGLNKNSKHCDSILNEPSSTNMSLEGEKSPSTNEIVKSECSTESDHSDMCGLTTLSDDKTSTTVINPLADMVGVKNIESDIVADGSITPIDINMSVSEPNIICSENVIDDKSIGDHEKLNKGKHNFENDIEIINLEEDTPQNIRDASKKDVLGKSYDSKQVDSSSTVGCSSDLVCDGISLKQTSCEVEREVSNTNQTVSSCETIVIEDDNEEETNLVDPIEVLELDDSDEIHTDWTKRWLGSEDVKKVVKTSKILTSARRKMKIKLKEKEETVLVCSKPPTDAPALIGSVEEYYKLVEKGIISAAVGSPTAIVDHNGKQVDAESNNGNDSTKLNIDVELVNDTANLCKNSSGSCDMNLKDVHSVDAISTSLNDRIEKSDIEPKKVILGAPVSYNVASKTNCGPHEPLSEGSNNSPASCLHSSDNDGIANEREAILQNPNCLSRSDDGEVTASGSSELVPFTDSIRVVNDTLTECSLDKSSCVELVDKGNILFKDTTSSIPYIAQIDQSSSTFQTTEANVFNYSSNPYPQMSVNVNSTLQMYDPYYSWVYMQGLNGSLNSTSSFGSIGVPQNDANIYKQWENYYKRMMELCQVNAAKASSTGVFSSVPTKESMPYTWVFDRSETTSRSASSTTASTEPTKIDNVDVKHEGFSGNEPVDDTKPSPDYRYGLKGLLKEHFLPSGKSEDSQNK